MPRRARSRASNHKETDVSNCKEPFLVRVNLGLASEPTIAYLVVFVERTEAETHEEATAAAARLAQKLGVLKHASSIEVIDAGRSLTP